MSKFLSIVIPRYKETELEVFPLISSIANQLGIDFADIEVIFANDGGGAGELDKDFLALFPKLDIRQVNRKENGGPGLARQAGIDNAKGQYLMFCDADDTLHNVGVLGAMIQAAEKNVPDILGTSWLEEMDTNGDKVYITHSHENTWMHGKFLRRQFLIQNGIRHHPELRVHEDSYILSIAASLTNRADYLDIISYVWKFGAESITRKNNAVYSYDSIPTFIYACTEADKVVEQKNPALMEYKIIQFIMYCFFCFHQPGWMASENRDYLKAAEEAFVKYMAPFWHYYEAADNEYIAQIYNEERSKNFAGCMEPETLQEWIKKLGLQAK